jgi:nucleotide-binding universal stress UspA family protein
MIRRILLGVNDSPAALAAARFAVDLAASGAAELRIVNVLTDGALEAALTAASREARTGGATGLASRRAQAGTAVLRHIADLAERAGVTAETAELTGEPADMILVDAERSGADMIVLGRGDRPGDRRPTIGPQALRILEFARVPVLLVPPRSDP